MSTPEDGLSAEERRLVRYLQAEETAWGWPSRLQRERPDLFPVPARNREREAALAADPRAVRWLLGVTVPIVVLLLLLEVTDALIGNAWMLALQVLVAGISLYSGFLYRHHVKQSHRHTWRAVFLAMLFMISLSGYFGVREKRTAGELAGLIDVVPEVTDVSYVPTVAEQQAVDGILTALLVEYQQAARLAVPPDTAAEPRYWLLTTALDPAAAEAFYERDENRRGWQIDAQDRGVFLLSRGDERLIVFIRDAWPRPGTLVIYVHHPVA